MIFVPPSLSYKILVVDLPRSFFGIFLSFIHSFFLSLYLFFFLSANPPPPPPNACTHAHTHSRPQFCKSFSLSLVLSLIDCFKMKKNYIAFWLLFYLKSKNGIDSLIRQLVVHFAGDEVESVFWNFD
jgi:hypothetical protein